MASKELYHLLRVLDDRDLGLGRDDVAWAFDSPETRSKTESWVHDYLQAPTLLAKEEHIFYERVGGHISQTSASTASRPLSDEDFEQAISSLESSTATIEKQCQRMEAQKQALLELKARNSVSDEDRDAAERQQSKAVRGQAQLNFEIEDLASSLQSKLRGAMKQTEAFNAGLPTTIERVLGKDDRLLDGMQKMLPKLGGRADEGRDLAVVDKLCDAFTVLEAKAIRARIDATYRAHLSDSPSQVNGHETEQKAAIFAELDELSGEIDGLLSLVVENHYRNPITRGLKNATTETQSDSARWSAYLASTLQYLTGRLESLEEHAQHIRAHQAAVGALSATLDEITLTPGRDRTKSETAPMTSGGLKPLRLVQANMSDSLDPSSHLLRLLDIKASNSLEPEQFEHLLEEVRHTRQAKLRSITASTDSAVARQVADSLAKSDVDVRHLLTAVYAHTEYNDRKLVDSDVQASVDRLEDKTKALGEQMRSLDLNGLSSDVRRMQGQLLK